MRGGGRGQFLTFAYPSTSAQSEIKNARTMRPGTASKCLTLAVSILTAWGAMAYAPSGVQYHPNGMVAGYTLANGITHSVAQNVRGLPAQWQDAGVMNDSYSYDPHGNVTGIQDLLQGVNTRSMGYDGLDRLTAAHGPWGSGLLGYDALDNLTYSQIGARTLSHQIDPASNRLTGLSGSQSVSMGYDANGNLSSRGGQAYSFDIANRMRAASGKAQYDYDGHGRRSWVVFADGSTQLNAYSGPGAAGQLRFSAHSVKGNTRYVYLGDKLIAETSSQTGTRYSHTDALGSPVARSNSAGAVTERTRYEPYGATVAGSTNPTGIGFTGHVNDADTGLVYMQQRYYDPIAGRFLSVDPVVTDTKTGSSFNRYVYGNNNPYKFKDPDGRFAETLWDIASLALSVNEFRSNPSVGNAIGVAVDAAAAIIPGIPGGVGAVRAATKAADGAADVASAGRAANKLKPVEGAQGAHSAIKTGADGKVTNTATYTPNPKNPSGFDEAKRVDVTGKAHTNSDGTKVSTPHVHEAGQKDVRPARPDELPK